MVTNHGIREWSCHHIKPVEVHKSDTEKCVCFHWLSKKFKIRGKKEKKYKSP